LGGEGGGTGNTSDPLWGCLDQPPATASGPLNLSVHVQKISDQSPVADAEVTVCRMLDPSCTAPLGHSITDAKGDAHFELPNRFRAFVRVTQSEPPSPEQQLVPLYYYLGPFLDGDASVTLQAMTMTLLQQLSFVVQVPMLTERGMVLVNALNCESKAAAGVAIRADAADDLAQPFFVVGGIPNTSRNDTDPTGYGGFFNLREGLTSLTGEIVATGRTYGTTTVQVRPGTITQTSLVPGSD
jgi:hypothetical protein